MMTIKFSQVLKEDKTTFSVTAERFGASRIYETDTEEVYEFAMKYQADQFELDLIMNNGVFPEIEEDTTGDYSRNKVYRVIIKKREELDEAMLQENATSRSWIDPDGKEYNLGRKDHFDKAAEILDSLGVMYDRQSVIQGDSHNKYLKDFIDKYG
jgi:hypothetical protein